MTPLFAVAFGLTAVVVLVFAWILWREDDETMTAICLAVPALAFLAASVEYVWRAIA